VRRVYHEFKPSDLVGGDLALDFVNTVTARDTDPSDFLDDYHALIRWARQTSGFRRKDLVELTKLARCESEKAAAALERCRRVRESLCAVFYALIARRQPETENVATIDQARKRAFNAARLNTRNLSLRVAWSVECSGLDLVTHVVTAHALDLLQNVSLDRLRVCAGTDCGWVFIDTSKNSTRRWCDMEVCGNAAKARRFRKRHA
jgi:predicted RNA-binding Zn ribbon-like protein